MKQQSGTPQIFNQRLRRLRRERAARRGKSFLLSRCAEDAGERLLSINRDFEHVIIIGLPGFSEVLQSALPPQKFTGKVINYNDWPEDFETDKADLILSGLVLQSLNDLRGAMGAARRALRPDGLFLSVLLGGESLLNLRRACLAADQALSGGAVPRVAPMLDLKQAAGLLGSVGFALPVTDRDACRVNYKALSTLFDDLRDIGETNVLTAYEPAYAGSAFKDELESFLGGSPFEITFDLIWMTGWSPHESQPKPLKPGSAKQGLNQALKAIRGD